MLFVYSIFQDNNAMGCAIQRWAEAQLPPVRVILALVGELNELAIICLAEPPV